MEKRPTVKPAFEGWPGAGNKAWIRPGKAWIRPGKPWRSRRKAWNRPGKP